VDLNRPENRKKFLDAMLAVAATIPDAASRDQFADRLAHRAGVTESVVRDEIRRAAVQRRPQAPAVAVQADARLRPAEVGLLWTLVHHPVEGLAALGQLEPEDLEGIVAGPVFRMAASLAEVPPDLLPELLRERLNEGELALLTRAAAGSASMAPAAECVHAIRRLRVERELAGLQRDIDQWQRGGSSDDGALGSLWDRKKELLRRLEEL
jgi:hypothetical protein